MSTPTFEIKKHKSCDGTDGVAYSCDLWVNGKLAAKVVNSGCGGCTDFYWLDKDLERITNEYVEALPPVPSVTDDEKRLWPDGWKRDLDAFVAELCDNEEAERKLRKLCKTKTLFRLVGESDEGVRWVKAPYSPQVVAYLKKKYGDKLAVILNEDPKYASPARN